MRIVIIKLKLNDVNNHYQMRMSVISRQSASGSASMRKPKSHGLPGNTGTTGSQAMEEKTRV